MNNWKVNDKIYKIKTRTIEGLFTYPRIRGLSLSSLKYFCFSEVFKLV